MATPDLLGRAVSLLEAAKSVLVFTGAGISVESGIPDFRSAGGLWEKFDPEVYASYNNFLQHPEMFWEMTKEIEKLLTAAAPNPAHLAVAELEALGKVCGVVTQNIDNLHQGSIKVFELHGNAKHASCISCKASFDMQHLKELIQSNQIPKCKSCDGLVKSDVILFGEKMPDSIETAMDLALSCDLVMIIGSSLTVSPANLIPIMAKQSGAKLIFVNLDSTPFDPIADVVLKGKAGEVLPQLVQSLKSKMTQNSL